MDYLKRSWAEIDLGAAEQNYKAIRSRLNPNTKVCCVVKADAYGHGAERFAQLYESAGADWLAVSNLEEAEQIRRAGVSLPILILGYTPPYLAGKLAAGNIAQAVVGPEYAGQLSAEAVKAGVTVRAHIQVDTGMSRVGFFYQDCSRDTDSIDAMEHACRLPGINAEGIFTHFAVADEGEGGHKYTERQFHCFMSAISMLGQRGIHFKIRHCANSAAILDFPKMQLDMVRPGIILYGLMPSGDIMHKATLAPVLSLKSQIALVKEVPPQTCVSYGRKFTSARTTAVATVPIGYADGYPRRFGGRASVLVHGRRAKVIGRVCMDQLMLDITGIPDVKAGDTVTIIGRDGSECISADELAEIAGTISYEILCGIATRIPRVFLRGNSEDSVLDYLKRI
ncbi:MAG TPA: alanine racemase [Ruminococcaceae bacterium]|jgi:alanine racemase|nr:alanine racemase [Oscillospiraceae bacterium]